MTPVVMILEVIMEMIIPLLMASIIDKGVEAGNIQHIVITGILMIFAAGFALLCGILGGVFGSEASTGFAKNLRKAMFDKIQTFSFANIDRFSTGSLVTRMTTDVINLQNAYQMILRMCFRAPISLVCAMVMSFSVNARLASIYLGAVMILGVIFVLAIIIIFIVKNAMKFFTQMFEKYDQLNSKVQENVSSIRVVKAFVREDHEKTLFQKALDGVYEIGVKAERIVALNMPSMMLAIYSCILLISWLGAKMIVQSELTTGELMMLLAYCMNILMNLLMLSMIFVMMTMSQASAKRIYEVLVEEPDIVNPENPVYEVADGSITFDHVTFRYYKDSEKPVLNDVSLSIRSGETIGIMGGTGSAKSTLANMISRLYDADSGVVKVGGRDVREYDLETIRNEVSVVLQKNVLFSGTILDNLRWGKKDATKEECIHACQLACADEFINKMPEGYETYTEQGGTNVSGGQRQRLCIARALLKNPKILILDDSTSAVDTATDAKIRKAFREEIPQITKLIIAQRISSVQDADRILVLDNGEINGFGSHEELLASNAIYRDVYESQTNGKAKGEGGMIDG